MKKTILTIAILLIATMGHTQVAMDSRVCDTAPFIRFTVQRDLVHSVMTDEGDLEADPPVPPTYEDKYYNEITITYNQKDSDGKHLGYTKIKHQSADYDDPITFIQTITSMIGGQKGTVAQGKTFLNGLEDTDNIIIINAANFKFWDFVQTDKTLLSNEDMGDL